MAHLQDFQSMLFIIQNKKDAPSRLGLPWTKEQLAHTQISLPPAILGCISVPLRMFTQSMKSLLQKIQPMVRQTGSPVLFISFIPQHLLLDAPLSL